MNVNVLILPGMSKAGITHMWFHPSPGNGLLQPLLGPPALSDRVRALAASSLVENPISWLPTVLQLVPTLKLSLAAICICSVSKSVLFSLHFFQNSASFFLNPTVLIM